MVRVQCILRSGPALTCALSRGCVLQVRVVLEGVDKYNNLFGSVLYPEGDKLLNLGEQIMQVGSSAGACSTQQQQQQGCDAGCTQFYSNGGCDNSCRFARNG